MRLIWFLNGDFPNRIQGRIDPETRMRKKKLGGIMLLKTQAQDRVDAYYLARRLKGLASDEQRRRALTDDYLLGLWFVWLPEYHPLRSAAARQVLLSDSIAGGVIELERLEKLVSDSADKKQQRKLNRQPVDLVAVRQVCELARDAFHKVLDRTVLDGFRLEVNEDIRAANKLEAHHQDRSEVARVRDEQLREWFVVLRSSYYSQRAAVGELAREYSRDPETIRAALRSSPLWGVKMAWEQHPH